MAQGRLQKAIGAVKDKTAMSIAKVSTASTVETEIEIKIVKATRHDSRPSDEKHIRDILILTARSSPDSSRQPIIACLSTISRRLNKTRNRNVALKALVLVHRLLLEGDAAYEEEVFYATKRGTRLLDMSEFRDGSWEFSGFVRSFARYLDERVGYRMRERRKRAEEKRIIPVRQLRTKWILSRSLQPMQMLERFIDCRPTGSTTENPIVTVAMYPLVKESRHIYHNLTEIMAILVDRFMTMEISYCIKVQDLFTSLSKKFKELSTLYDWCKSVGIGKPSDYPTIVEEITQSRLDMMDGFIRERSALAQNYKTFTLDNVVVVVHSKAEEDEEEEEVKAFPLTLPLPPPATVGREDNINGEENTILHVQEKEVDLLNLHEENYMVITGGDMNVAIGLPPTNTIKWESFATDWETALVQSATSLSNHKPSLPAAGIPQSQPYPSSDVDPFSASMMVAPPSSAQNDTHLPEEKVDIWQAFAMDTGLEGKVALKPGPNRTGCK